jgi:hypothetical protein
MKLGALDISTVKLGTNQVQAVYQGSNLVWQNAPVATAATGVGQTSFTANWNAYSGATYYLLDVSESSDFSTFVYENQIVEAPNTSYVVIGLNSNTTYYYRVRASTEALTDPDAQAFFDRVTAAEGSLSTAEQDAVNTLVEQMKADGIWTKMKAIYPMVGASSAACAQNLKSSSFTGTFTSGWTFASTGVTPNGTSAYMNTFFNPANESSVASNNFSMGVYLRTQVAATDSQMGNFNTSGDCLLLVNYTGNRVLYRLFTTGDNFVASSGNVSKGLTSISTLSTSTQKVYKQGSLIYTGGNTTTTKGSKDIYIGAINGISLYSAAEFAFSYIGNGLTDTEASDFYTAVQAFQTTLSRQV